MQVRVAGSTRSLSRLFHARAAAAPSDTATLPWRAYLLGALAGSLVEVLLPTVIIAIPDHAAVTALLLVWMWIWRGASA